MGKKRKNADFQKVKIKVGRKLPRLNETTIDLRSRKLHIVDQGLSVDEQRNDVNVGRSFHQVSKKLSFSNQSEDHLTGMQQVISWVESDTFTTSGITPADILRVLVPHCRNTRDSRIRSAACRALSLLMRRLADCQQDEFHSALAAAPLTTLDHLDPLVRREGLPLLRSLAEHLPAAVRHPDRLAAFTSALGRYRERVSTGVGEGGPETVRHLVDTHAAVLNCIQVISPSSVSATHTLNHFHLGRVYWHHVFTTQTQESCADVHKLAQFYSSTLRWCGELWRNELRNSVEVLRLVRRVYELHVQQGVHESAQCADCAVPLEIAQQFPVPGKLKLNCQLLELVALNPQPVCSNSQFAAKLHTFLRTYYNKKLDSTECGFWLRFSRPVITCWELRTCKTARLLLSLIWKLLDCQEDKLPTLTLLTESLELRWAACRAQQRHHHEIVQTVSVEPFTRLPGTCVSTALTGCAPAVELLLRLNSLRFPPAVDQLLHNATALEKVLKLHNHQLLLRTLHAALQCAQDR